MVKSVSGRVRVRMNVEKAISSDSEEEFDDDKVQSVFDHFVVALHDQRRTLWEFC